MKNAALTHDRVVGAIYGMFIGDSLAMPVHWYYDTTALVRDYGKVTDYLPPKNPHPDSILWRSSYTPLNARGEILHDQAQYWGKRGIHYHQFLKPGENTLNLQLAHLLLQLLLRDADHSRKAWLEAMITFLSTPGNHNDTYVEEYLRAFFTNYAKGIPPEECGRKDENHIGGFSLMLPVTLFFAKHADLAIDLSVRQLELTHGGEIMHRWGTFIAETLVAIIHGTSLPDALVMASKNSNIQLEAELLTKLADYPDLTVVGRHFSSACYVDQSVPATLYLALKYATEPEEGMIANTMCGGDNCGRGALLGALLGAMNGMSCWPDRWVAGLVSPPPLPVVD